VADAQVGQFSTQKVTYRLDYSSQTVQALNAIGVSPNDPVVLATTDYIVTYWVDRATGLLVKSKTAYKYNLMPQSYEVEYTALKASAPDRMPEAPAIIDTASFAVFLRSSLEDYQGKAACLGQPASPRDSCLKNLATDRNSWEVCGLIGDKTEYEL